MEPEEKEKENKLSGKERIKKDVWVKYIERLSQVGIAFQSGSSALLIQTELFGFR